MKCGMGIAECGLPSGETMMVPEMEKHSPFPIPHSTFPVHRPVMVKEVIEFLALRPGQTVVDCTVGTGGHSLAILPHLMPSGRLIAIDRDAQALALAQTCLTEFSPHVRFVHENFWHLPQILKRLGVTAVNGLVADLGLSSVHVEVPERGFSFLKEGPLDMRMDQRQTTTAASLIQRLSEQELARLLYVYGEERWSRRIARRIATARAQAPIRTTTQLARLVAEAIPAKVHSRRLHVATRTFLALRITVNEELAALEALLQALPDILAPGGRAVVLAFHSLEDRLVKRAFQQGAKTGVFRLLTKRPLRPSAQELAENPRSRSSRLRAVERL